MLGFGDRRFIPTPSDIAARFWQLTVSGELAVNTLATLWRVVAGFVIGVVPAIAIGLCHGDVPSGAHLLRSADCGAVPDPEGRADAAPAARLRLRRCLEDRAGRDRRVLPGDRQHLCGRGQYRENLLGRLAQLWREPSGHVHAHRVLRRAADDLRRPAHRGRGGLHRAGRRRIRLHQSRHRLPDLEFLGVAARSIPCSSASW